MVFLNSSSAGDVDIYRGDLLVREASQIFSYTSVTGDVKVSENFQGEFDFDLQFPKLQNIDGTLDITGVDGLTSITTREVKEYYTDSEMDIIFQVNIRNSNNNTVSIGNMVRIGENNYLQAVTLPRITYIGSNLEVFDNNEIENVSFENLESIGHSDPKFEVNSWSLTSVTSSNNPKLINFELPSLTTIRSGLDIYDSYELTYIDLAEVNEIGHIFMDDQSTKVNLCLVLKNGLQKSDVTFGQEECIHGSELEYVAGDIPVCSYVW